MALVNAFGAMALEATLAALHETMKDRFDPVLTATANYTTAGTYPLVDPPVGQRVRAVWLYAQARGSLGEATVLVTFTLGANSYQVELTGSQPFMHSAVWEGPVDGNLTVTIDVDASVLVNCDYRLFS